MSVNSHASAGAPQTKNAFVAFDAPASADTVTSWFVTHMRGRGFAVTRAGNQLQAKSGDGTRADLVVNDRPDGSAATLTISKESSR